MTEAAATSQAGQFVVDAQVRYVARVYAEAYLGAAEKEQQVDAALDELESFVRDVVQANPRFSDFLRNRLVSRENKEQSLQKALDGRVSSLLLRFLLVLARHERLDVLAGVAAVCREMDNQRRNRVPVQVTSAVLLEAELADAIGGRLSLVLGKQALVECRVDAALLGGLVVRVGDSVYDGSVATQLERLREQMLQRSIHEIQSGRDRFGDPAGD